MTDYGVVSTGFSRKPLSVILSEIEASNITIFGPGLVQTSQSPMGQLNGLRADLITQAWEMFEDVYQSYDPDQADGTRLDILARLRLITRQSGETDASLRSAISNAGLANTRDADFYRAVVNVDGVTYAKIYANDDNTIDANGLDPHSVSVAVLGGDDVEIATVARQYIVPGISSFGNTAVSTTVGGFCRSMRLLRPDEVPITLALTVSKQNGANGCPPPSNAAIAQALWLQFNAAATRPDNGQDITLHMIRTYVSCAYPNVQIMDIDGGRVGGAQGDLPISIGFAEIATLGLNAITITAV
ncbi:hypothetical protein IFT84_17390 [Rhizobium sp. CFBP 8762]|uniref:hypothetical protein n=1 Tax=Rhizobium sp. CFBP 8762 TaxID=2775279 RepID=UPI0017845980|nr:hypothetical protein [Rhizobium sp. CFBP 8762]MBD8556285.1 hypothetical protein [Rhizobium sp. CFBP 8762]